MNEVEPKYLGMCMNEISRNTYCGRRVFDDSFYETIPELICEPCVERIIFGANFNDYTPQKAVFRSEFCPTLTSFNVRRRV